MLTFTLQKPGIREGAKTPEENFTGTAIRFRKAAEGSPRHSSRFTVKLNSNTVGG